MQAYQAGVAALRLSLKDVTVERAESLVDQIQEVSIYFKAIYGEFLIESDTFLSLMYPFLSSNQLCDTQDEVNQTISGGVTSGGMSFF